jgi:hypothetical protein
MPSLGDAFAALLAAEQGDRSTVTGWPGVAHPPPPPAPAPAITEDVIEEVVRRVLERMSDAVVRETTADLVSSVAERLVREEIDRIRASSK